MKGLYSYVHRTNAAFLIGATIKNKAIWLYKSIPIVITNEERSTTATFLIGNDKTLKQALEAKQIDNAMCFSCGNDSTNEERSSNAAFLKGDNKRGGDSGDDPWAVGPRSRAWLSG